jgi:hypothetical protein
MTPVFFSNAQAVYDPYRVVSEIRCQSKLAGKE